MEERNNSSVVIAVIITILVMIVLGLVGFIVYDKVINKTNEPSTGENNKVDDNENKDVIVDYDLSEAKKIVDKYYMEFSGFGKTTFDEFDEAAKICIAQKHMNENLKKDVDCNKVYGKDKYDVENLSGSCWNDLTKSVSYDDFNKVYKSLFAGNLEKKDNAKTPCVMDYNDENNEFILLEFLGGGDSSDIYMYDVLSAKLTNESQLTIEVGYVVFECVITSGSIENESCTPDFDENINYVRNQLTKNGFEQQFIKQYSNEVKVLKFNFTKANDGFILKNIEA